MKTILFLFLSIAAATAADYFVIEADGTLSNRIVANADFSPGSMLSKALVSSLPAGAKVGDKWDGSTVTSVSTPLSQQGIKDFLASYGYDEIALLNLVDIQTRLKEADIALPAKAAAVREWITATQIAYVQGQPYPAAPYNYAEVLAELKPLLSP